MLTPIESGFSVVFFSPLLVYELWRYWPSIARMRRVWRIVTLAVVTTIIVGAVPAGFYYAYHPIPVVTEQVTFFTVESEQNPDGQQPETNFCDQATAVAYARELSARNRHAGISSTIYVIPTRVTVWSLTHKAIAHYGNLAGRHCQSKNPFVIDAIASIENR